MATWNDGAGTSSSKTSETTWSLANGFAPTVGSWVMIAIVADANMPATTTCATTGTPDETNPVRLVVTDVAGTGTGGVRVSLFAHKAATATSRGYTFDFQGTSVVAKAGRIVGEFVGSDVPEDSESTSDLFDPQSDVSTSGSGLSAGWNSSPHPTWDHCGAMAILGIEDASGTAINFNTSNVSFSSGATSNSTVTGSSGQGATSNVALARSVAYGTDGVADATGNVLWGPAGTGTDSVLVAFRLLGSSGNSLVIAAPTHNHTADNVALTQVHNLVINDATHAHSADNVAVVKNVNLAVADATHAHAADGNLVLTVVKVLAINDATHSHLADNVALAQTHILGVDEPRSLLTSDTVDLVTVGSIGIDAPLHGVSSDEVALTQRGTVNYVTTPVREPYAWGETGLTKFYKQIEGVTYWKVGDEWFSGNYQEDEIAGASVVYRGGYEYRVTDPNLLAELLALGFTISRQEFEDV